MAKRKKLTSSECDYPNFRLREGESESRVELPAKPHTTYSEKLKDPRWQRKRLEIMERDGFCCLACGSGIKTLNVHHTYYERGFSPWEYPSESLSTLCESCHRQTEHAMRQIRLVLADVQPVTVSGFACDLLKLSAQERANAMVIFGWIARDRGRFAAMVEQYKAHKKEVMRRRGLVEV